MSNQNGPPPLTPQKYPFGEIDKDENNFSDFFAVTNGNYSWNGVFVLFSRYTYGAGGLKHPVCYVGLKLPIGKIRTNII